MGWEDQKTEVKEQVAKEETIPIQFISLDKAEKKRGIKVGIYGDFATGKTHFALTAPEPIFIIDTEMGAPPLSHSFKGKDIKILDVAEKDGSKSYEKIIKAVDFIEQQDRIGTVIIDSISDFWEFCQEYAKVNIFKIKPEQRLAQQWDWGIINKLYLRVLLKLLKLDCNLVVTARESEVYTAPGQPTGMVKPKWQKNTGFWVDFVLYNSKKVDKIGNMIFTTSIEKSRPVGELMGKKFSSLDFDGLVNEINKLKESQNESKNN
ncbi:MAG: AAA family ATPase [Candidatus Heimdallarchaeaceae archaeon]